MIAERRGGGGDHGDVLSALLAAREADGDGLTDTEITDQLALAPAGLRMRVTARPPTAPAPAPEDRAA